MQKKNAVTPFGTNRPPFTPLVMNVRLLQIAIHYIAPVTLIFGQQARAHQDMSPRASFPKCYSTARGDQAEQRERDTNPELIGRSGCYD